MPKPRSIFMGNVVQAVSLAGFFVYEIDWVPAELGRKCTLRSRGNYQQKIKVIEQPAALVGLCAWSRGWWKRLWAMWPALRAWLEEDREGLHIHRHLTEAAQELERLDRDAGELYRGARLATASEWAEEHAEEVNPLEREFLEASQELARCREAEREAQRQRELEMERQRAEECRRYLHMEACLAMP